ncbi:TlpA disulfide reductase family protein [Candidatus Amarolinea aalborgensis]|uniref:TlpA disulfide reductase family protein n=1 Tax=Candidatus Amarolinea aalborgensis TaxID=2249329 RepID=UPI003BFA1E96
MKAARLTWLLLLIAGLVWINATRVQDATLFGPPGQRPPSPQVGFPAPDFSLSRLDGQSVRLADWHGQPVVLNFWATWCPPCRAEMPALQAAAQAYGDQGVRVLGVNQAEEANQVAGFMQTLGLDFPVLLDRDAAVSQLYRVRSLPTTFFIDREGVIREIIIGGPMSQALLASKMESLLK